MGTALSFPRIQGSEWVQQIHQMPMIRQIRKACMGWSVEENFRHGSDSKENAEIEMHFSLRKERYIIPKLSY